MLSEVKSAALSLRRLSARPSPHCWLVVVEPVDLREDEERGKQAGQRKKGGEQRRMGLVRLAMGMRSPKAATSPLGWGSSPSRSRLGSNHPGRHQPARELRDNRGFWRAAAVRRIGAGTLPAEEPRRRRAGLRSAANVSAVILHKAEWRAALRSPRPASHGEGRAVSIARSNGSVVRIGGPRPPAGFLLSVRQLARLQRIAALFIDPLVGDCRKRLRFP